MVFRKLQVFFNGIIFSYQYSYGAEFLILHLRCGHIESKCGKIKKNFQGDSGHSVSGVFGESLCKKLDDLGHTEADARVF